MTRPGAASLPGRVAQNFGKLTLRERGWYFIRHEGDDALVAEMSTEVVDRPLALPAGNYEVVKRAPDHLLVGSFSVSSSSDTEVTEAAMHRIDFGRVVRKGGTRRTRALGLYASGGVRGSLLSLGPAATLGVGVRLDRPAWTATAVVEGGRGSVQSARATRLETDELDLRLGALKLFDARIVSLGLGAEVGASRLSQLATDQPSATASYALTVGPLGVIEAQVLRRYFLWLEGAAPVYAMEAETDSRTSATRTARVTFRALLALGGFL